MFYLRKFSEEWKQHLSESAKHRLREHKKKQQQQDKI
jgi:hypothetical protein